MKARQLLHQRRISQIFLSTIRLVCTAGLVLASANAQTSPPPGVPEEIWHPGVSGKVVDATQAVLPGVLVRLRGIEPPRAERSVRTNQRGHYFVPCLEDGLYEISFSLPGFFETSTRFKYLYPMNLGIDQILNFPIDIAPVPSINYVVVDKETGLPVAGARIEVEGANQLIETDQCGQTWGGRLGENVITVRKDGYRTAQRRVDLHKNERINLRFELAPNP